MPDTAPLTLGQQSVGFGPQGFGPGGNARAPLPLPPEGPPKRNPVLTRADMETVIRHGGSVSHNGRVIGHEHLLPTDEELAAGDDQQTARVAAQHEANIAYSQAMLKRLGVDTETASASAKAKAEAEAEAKAKADAEAAAKLKANGGK